MLEMMGVSLPWPFITNGFLFGCVVCVEGITMRINELYIVIKLYLDRVSMEFENNRAIGLMKTYPTS